MVEVNVIMGAGMDSVVVDVVDVNVIMGAGMHSLVSDFAGNNRNLAVVEVTTASHLQRYTLGVAFWESM